MAHRGKFKPKNPAKYVGDVGSIVYRSSWELKFMHHLDQNAAVLEWSSEEFSIPYISPLDNKFHRYFPDFRCKVKNVNGVVETLIVEIKPHKEDALNGSFPERGRRLMRYYLREVATWGVNKAKFDAALNYCEDRGWKFQVLTENDLAIYGETRSLPHKKTKKKPT